jgi:hypothetical protein
MQASKIEKKKTLLQFSKDLGLGFNFFSKEIYKILYISIFFHDVKFRIIAKFEMGCRPSERFLGIFSKKSP